MSGKAQQFSLALRIYYHFCELKRNLTKEIILEAYTIDQMASTGPDIEKAYGDLFNAANMISADHGKKFRMGDKLVSFRLLGPATLHVIETSFRSPNHWVDIIFDNTHVPPSFSQAEQIETLALAAARALVLEKIKKLVKAPAPL